ncbi:MAG: DUF255 domain-containing protein [Pirellulales bacterium]|nr:DUF255 domain-containing protein [Pirellulales bacterium]
MDMRRFFSGRLLSVALSVVLISQAAQAESINWRVNLDAAKVEASRSGRFVLLHFWTPSCGPCRVLERDVFALPQVGAALEKDFVPVKVNADVSPALASYYQIDRLPSEIVLSPQGTSLTRLSCPMTADAYAAQLADVARHFRQALGSQKTPQPTVVQSAYAGLEFGRQGAAATPPAAPPVAAPPQPTVTNNPYVGKPPLVARPKVSQSLSAPAAQIADNRYTASVPAYAPVTQTQPPATPPLTMAAPAPTAAPTPTTAPVAPVPAATARPVVAAPSLAAKAAPQLSEVQTTSAQSAEPLKVEITLPQQSNPQSVASRTIPTSNIAARLPEGSPPLGFEGYCPVSLKYERKWVAGRLQFGAYHHGRTYLFAGYKQQQQFLASPDVYSPVFAGLDAVKMLDENQQVDGSRKFGFEYRGAFYLFSSQETMARFAESPDRYSAGVRQAMNRMDASSSHVMRR